MWQVAFLVRTIEELLNEDKELHILAELAHIHAY